MQSELISLFALSLLISLSTFGGGSQVLYYQYAVIDHQWLSKSDLSAVLAFSYATPGPAAFSTSTFIGYSLGGVAGAVIGTVGIFVIPFATSFMAARYLRGLVGNIHACRFVQGVGLAATGLVAATAYSLLEPFSAPLWQFAVAVVSFALTLIRQVNPFLILMAGLAVGILVI